ncbi:MAG: DNA (cytosine-5-)-methyltransferase, partial [Pseudomonas sp.]|nr:DNA (cytosine-5-)-methyltransferase [Pseudomonas sp.]
MRYLSVCSGIEAATVAWYPLGWKPAAFSEIEKFPRAVLAHHYPDVPCHGDFTTIGADEYGPIDLLVGGTPCQSFSIAGLRGGLADDRGNLALEFLRLAQRTRPEWLVWENVPGVLSSNGGRDFGAILGGMAELGYGFAYRVLDAQFFGVPQRRRRVFVIGHLGDWRRAAAVLFERESLSGNPAPRREARSAVAALTANGVGTCGADDNQGQAGHLVETSAHRMLAMGEYAEDGTASAMKARDYKDATDLVAHSLRGEGFDASEDGTGRGTPLVPVAIQERAVSENPGAGPDGKGWRDDGQAYTLEARQTVQAVAFAQNQKGKLRLSEQAGALTTMGGKPGQGYPAALQGSAVRRLTPRECERLQGFPDDYTQIPWRGKAPEDCPDGPRYKALGNSMAVPCM